MSGCLVTEPLFEEIEHTADLAFVVRGRDQAELFARAGRALFALMVDIDGVCARERRAVEVTATGMSELLHEWLSRLLELFCCEGFVAREIVVRDASPTSVCGELGGEIFEHGRHAYLREIKAVTYHALEVSAQPGGWRAQVTVDV